MVSKAAVGARPMALGILARPSSLTFACPVRFPIELARRRSCGRCRAIVPGVASEQALEFEWQLVEGPGGLTGTHNQAVAFLAPSEPGLTRVQVMVRQNDIVCVGEALITVTHELLAQIG